LYSSIIETLCSNNKCFVIDNLEHFANLLPKSKRNTLNKWIVMDNDNDYESDKLKNKEIKKNNCSYVTNVKNHSIHDN
jgi:hypothetical protein